MWSVGQIKQIVAPTVHLLQFTSHIYPYLFIIIKTIFTVTLCVAVMHTSHIHYSLYHIHMTYHKSLVI
jgi:hypothetical protein